jgi:hypothetical protein
MRNRDRLILDSFGRFAVFAFVLAILAATTAATAFAQTTTTPAPSAETLKNWHAGMRRVPLPKKGCFTSSYPSTTWQEVPCTAAPAVPFPPARGAQQATVGNGNDVSAEVTGQISEAIGSFDSVTGVTSETGTNPYTGAKNVPNVYSLQLNSNFFTTSICNGAANPLQCQGWQQFVYASDDTNPTAFIQYWLINYGPKCPVDWNSFEGSCYTNSNAVFVPQQSITNLVTLSLTGEANAGGMDTLIMAVGSTVYTISADDNVVNLAQGWQEAEFNIVGDGNGTAANFNSGSTIVVRTSVGNGTLNAPSCFGQGFTGETNNLSFATAPVAQVETLPAIVFTESSTASSTPPCAAATAVGGSTTGGTDKLADTHDFNGDGKSDILWRDTAGNVGLWLMDGSQILSATVLGNVPTNWSVVGQRSFTGTADADILWRDTVGDVGIWLMNGNQITLTLVLGNVPTNWSVAGTGDFNGDGKADILWRDNAGNVGIWFMNGTTIQQTAVVGNMPTTWVIVGADMKGDIFWRNTATGEVEMWVMNGTQIAQAVDFGAVALTWTIAGIGDFDGNGSFDFLWRDSSGNVGVWLMNGTQIMSTAVFGNMPLTWTIAQTGDYSGAGRSDILWIDNTGNVTVWFMNGATIASTTNYGNVGTSWSVQSLNAD